MGDQILLYNLMRDYSVYQTITPLGFYRWGANSMIELDSTRKVVQNGFDFREYVYAEHPMIGMLFRKCHYKKFTYDVLEQRNSVSRFKMDTSVFDDIYDQKPGVLSYLFFKVISRSYSLHKKHQTKRLAKKAETKMLDKEWSKF